jgi:ABC-type amino acid transport system permease subunit
MEPFGSSIVVLSAYTSTFVAETIRSGFNAVPKGQAEAARALGLTFPGVLGRVVLPQALRTVVAPLGSLFIALTKNSSIAATISGLELTTVMNDLGFETARWLPLFAGTAIAYLLLTIPSGLAFGVLERRVAIKR